MENTPLQIDSLHDLLIHEMSGLYSATNEVMSVLPRMAQTASAPELRYGFEEHLTETRRQARRLESIFEVLDTEPVEWGCDGMTGIVCEIDRIIAAQMPADIKDAALISAARKMEHYALSGYAAARTYARVLELDDAVEMLQQTLDYELCTDQQFTEITERAINVQASGG